MAPALSPHPNRRHLSPTRARGRAPHTSPSQAGRFVDRAGRIDIDAIMAAFDRHAAGLFQGACLVAGPVVAADVVEALMIDIGRRPERYDLDDRALSDLLETEARRAALDARIEIDRAGFGHRFGPAAARRLASLPDPERDLIALCAAGRYTSRSLAALLGESPAVLAARLRAGLVQLRAGATAGDHNLTAGPVVDAPPTGGEITRWRS